MPIISNNDNTKKFLIKGTNISMNIPNGFIVRNDSFYNSEYKFTLSFVATDRKASKDNLKEKFDLTKRKPLKNEFLWKKVKNELSSHFFVIKKPFYPGGEDCFWFIAPIVSESYFSSMTGVYENDLMTKMALEEISSALVHALETLSEEKK